MSSRREQKQQARAERTEREQARAAAERRRRRLWQLGAVVAAAAVLVAALILVSEAGEDTPDPEGSDVAGAAEVGDLFRGITQDGIELGDPAAPVVLTEFADLQCPFCGQFAVDVLPEIVERYVRPGDVRVVFRSLSFLGEDSERGALAATAAAEQDRMWQFIDLFFRNQGTENTGYATDAFLRKLAAAVPGLDADRVVARANGGPADPLLIEANRLAGRYGISSTPSFLVGRRGEQPQPAEVADLTIEEFADLLDERLGR